MQARHAHTPGPQPGDRIGRGAHVAALFNGQAKQVTAAVVEAFRKALPDALVRVSTSMEEAQRFVAEIAAARPQLVISGGGDGAVMMLLNLLRDAGVVPFPAIGILRLGTGNAWARTLGAGPMLEKSDLLPRLVWPLPTQRFQLLEVEGRLTHFAGVGWDARIVNDYKRNKEQQERTPVIGAQLGRLHTGLRGYLYSLARLTIPGELAHFRRPPRGTVETPDAEAFVLDPNGYPRKSPGGLLYQGMVSICSAATVPEFGYGIRAFPFATTLPGYLNARVWACGVLESVARIPELWKGAYPGDGMHDFFAKRFRMKFDRPLPFQIGGDGHGNRQEIEVGLSAMNVEAVDWRAARQRAA